MVEYKIVGGGWEKVEKEVKELLEQGWELQGGISVSTHPEYEDQFAQAMIKKSKPKRTR